MCVEYIKSVFHRKRYYTQDSRVKTTTRKICGDRLLSRSQLESTIEGSFEKPRALQIM